MKDLRECWLLLLLVAFVISIGQGCSSDGDKTMRKSEIQKSDSIHNWLLNDKNYVNKEQYRKVFMKHFDEAIAKKNYDEAKMLLVDYGDMIFPLHAYDSLYHRTLNNFIDKHNETLLSDSTSATLYYLSANQYHNLNQVEKMRLFTLKGLEKCNFAHAENMIIRLKNFMGLYYTEKSQPEKAIQVFMEVIPLAEKLKAYRRLGSLYNNMAYCYDMLYASTESARMYEKSAKSFLLAKDTTNYLDLSITYAINQLFFSNDTLKTVRLIDSSLAVFAKYKQARGMDSCNANNGLAYKYYLTKQYEKAKYHIDKSTDYFKSVGNEELLPYNQNLATLIYFAQHKKLEDSPKVEELAKQLLADESYYDAIELYGILYANAKTQGNYAKALEFRNKEVSLNDSLTVKNQKGQLFELEKKYETQKKEQEILTQKNEISQKNTFIALLVASLAGLVLIIIVYYLWQKQAKLKQEKENGMNFTKQLLENTEEERKRIASDLHDSISHELLNLKSIFTQDLAVVNTKIDTIINDIRGISRNLHPVMFDKIGLVPNIEQLVERIQNQNNFFISTDISYAGKLTSADELQIYRIIQEALTNVIKYANAHAAKITIEEQPDKILVELRDNGHGFNVKETLNSGKAFGLHNIIERSRVIGGEANITSSPNGTIITINIPKKL
ncbi:hypothetical protein GCM10011514_18910 [Emticicia aquatilis]|uniref:histidine kinase n=1 Tax=Emticicia aquatilis TaxID=1537369 RepID=A0A917DPR0_9BACT|nr:sensor histidine kinase [Emticicia aquatilis]GGD54941.1 hypothetical protein GCM10011514_18910 [Emticicia aquatilis]